MSRYSFFMPVINKNSISMSLPGRFKKTSVFNSPCFASADDDNTVKLFLDAVSKWRFDEAKAYFSKNFHDDFDESIFEELFANTTNYKKLYKAEFNESPRNCKTDSVLLLEEAGKKGIIMHLHMMKEPDSYSKWKIYRIETE